MLNKAEPKKQYAPCYQCISFAICNSLLKQRLKIAAKIFNADRTDIEDATPDESDLLIALHGLEEKCFLMRAYMHTNKQDVYIYRSRCIKAAFDLTIAP